MSKREKKPDTSGLNTYSLGKESKLPDCGTAWKLYERGLDFNSSINLEDTVRVNENFFIGKQLECVISNGLPTPVVNFLPRCLRRRTPRRLWSRSGSSTRNWTR